MKDFVGNIILRHEMVVNPICLKKIELILETFWNRVINHERPRYVKQQINLQEFYDQAKYFKNHYEATTGEEFKWKNENEWINYFLKNYLLFKKEFIEIDKKILWNLNSIQNHICNLVNSKIKIIPLLFDEYDCNYSSWMEEGLKKTTTTSNRFISLMRDVERICEEYNLDI